MENAIKKAIEGGYKGVNTVCSNCQESWLNHIPTRIGNRYCGKPDENTILLDPLFWQSLGKQQGWPEHNHIKRWGEEVNSWYAQMHNLIDHIAVGGSIDDYFNNLIK